MPIPYMNNSSIILQRQQYNKITNDPQICQLGAFRSFISHPWVMFFKAESVNLVTDARIFLTGLYNTFNL